MAPGWHLASMAPGCFKDFNRAASQRSALQRPSVAGGRLLQQQLTYVFWLRIFDFMGHAARLLRGVALKSVG